MQGTFSNLCSRIEKAIELQDIENLRRLVDRFDDLLATALAFRIAAGQSIVMLKAAKGAPAVNPIRERAIKVRLKKIAHEVRQEFLEDVWNRIFQETRGPDS